MKFQQLISYIAPGAPATRRPASGDLPYLRPEIGFTPKWYHEALGIDFGKQWHCDPLFRKSALLQMRHELDRRFPGNRIGNMDYFGEEADLLTGVFGACTIAAMFGVPIRYDNEQWPTSEHFQLSDEDMMNLEPIDPGNNTFFLSLMEQVEKIAELEGRVVGFVNWQGVLNNAQRLRGQQLFMDMLLDPEMAMNLMKCVTMTMIDAVRILQERQRSSGVDNCFFTVSNCLVNMIQPDLYEEFVFPFDKLISESFATIGIHNCAWNATPYLDSYARIPRVGYIDMGIGSDLERARKLFPDARRALMYTPMDMACKPIEELQEDLESIAKDYGPCDIVVADIEAGTPDSRVKDFIALCEQLSRKK